MALMAIVGGTIFDGTGAVIEDGLLLIEGSRILSVTTSGSLPIPSTVTSQIDARGLFIMPGLIDAHNHLGSTSESRAVPDNDAGIALMGAEGAVTHLQSGVTTMRLCGERNFVDLEWRQAILDGRMPGPRLVVAGRGITSSNGHGRRTGWVCDSREAIRKAIRVNVRNQVDWIKLYLTGSRASKGTVPDTAYFSEDEIKTAIEESHRVGMRVGAHCHGGHALDWSLDAGIDVIEHGTSLTEEQAARMAASGTMLVATLGVYFGNSPNPIVLDKLSSANLAAFESVGRAARAGVPIAVGGDTRHTESTLSFELHCLVRCGISQSDALIAATASGARASGVDGERGTLAAGKFADILLVEGNPLADLEDLRSVKYVLRDGRIVFEAGLT